MPQLLIWIKVTTAGLVSLLQHGTLQSNRICRPFDQGP